MFDFKTSQTTLIALVRLAVMLFAIFMFVTHKWDLLQATAITLGVNTLLTSYGFLKAQDANQEVVVSKTTVRELPDGQQQVKVTTDMPADEGKTK